MDKAPKGLRLQIGLFGRTNVGKSSFLNMVVGQDVAITSVIPGTTTDVVEKTMELLPVGPVVFLDTGGIDDTSALAEKRIAKTQKIFARADVVVLIVEPNVWTSFEENIVRAARSENAPLIIVVNKNDTVETTGEFFSQLDGYTPQVMACTSIDRKCRDRYVSTFKQLLIAVCPEDFLAPPALIGDLVAVGGIAVLIIPIDKEAPKGRIILPQVQAIRDLLDNDAAAFVVKENEYRAFLEKLKTPPDIVVCDSQVVDKMVADTPPAVPCTTFSILLARFKGDLVTLAKGAATAENLAPGDRVLIAEACSHHAIEDDIGRVKIPRWIREHSGGDVVFDVCSGRDYPSDLTGYRLIIHCGACMLTRREMLYRIEQAQRAHVAITNYGVCIAALKGVAARVLAPFPSALQAYQDACKNG